MWPHLRPPCRQTHPYLICYYSIYQPGLSKCRCFWKWRTVNSNISAFSNLVCFGWCTSPVFPLPFFVDSNISAFSMAKLWLIRARRLFSIKGLFVRLFELSWCMFGDAVADAAGEGSAIEIPWLIWCLLLLDISSSGIYGWESEK